MRNRFDEQLELLNLELIKMGALCEDAIAGAAKALTEESESLYTSVQRAEQQIDQKEREIESLCMRLLLQQQPVASDLRTISSAMKMISDLERIGDQAADIVEITKFIHGVDLAGKVHIDDMARATIKMVTDSVDSFVRKDLKLVQQVKKSDDIVDGLFDEVKGELIRLIAQGLKEGEACIDLLMIAKYFERIGDHAVNVAEWVEFSISGLRTGEES